MTLKKRHGGPAPGGPDEVSGNSEVHSITDAAAAHSAEMRQRMIKYAVAMGIRMVCLVLVFVLDGWFRVLPILGAVFLPWIAVVIANGSDTAESHSDALLDNAPLVELDQQVPPEGSAGGPQAGAAGSGGDDPSMVLLQGELIDDDDDDDQRRAAS